MKTQILDAIGETGLRQAAALNAGLAANDRIKYFFSLLQMALSHAEHPDRPAVSLKQERLACGIDDPDLDAVTSAARMSEKSCHLPGAKKIMARIAGDMRMMAGPVLATPMPDSGDRKIGERLESLLAALPDVMAVKHFSAAGTPALLVRRDTSTSDFEGMALAAGILTASGGRTSHAAVVARQVGKVCLVASPDLTIDLDRRECRIGAAVIKEGDVLSLDGDTGAVYAGKLTELVERPERALAVIASWRQAAVA